MPHSYTEDQLVELPAIGLFAELGYERMAVLIPVCSGRVSGCSRDGEVALTASTG